ncbi:MAG: putative two-component system response regulator [Desulforhopalus sp.]
MTEIRPESKVTEAKKHRILVIEDQVEIRELIAEYLCSKGYDARTAENGLDGMFILEQWPADLVTLDLDMPIMNGHTFIQKALARWPELPIVVVSGAGGVEDAVEALRLGGYDFITKPIQNFSLLDNTIVRALEAVELVRQNRHYQKNLEKMVELRTYELEETKRQLLYSLGKSAEYRDNETGRHVIRVGQICGLLGKVSGMPEAEYKTFGEAAPLHDIGKIGISDTILLKPGKLTGEEWGIMKTHCEIGCNILRHYSTDPDPEEINFKEIIAMADDISQLAILDMAMVIALCHHEKWDGGGYPCRLSGEDIPLIARIVAVVDVYDALGSERPYKEPLSEELCQKIIREGSGNHFDPEVVELFFDNIDEIIDIKKRWVG